MQEFHLKSKDQFNYFSVLNHAACPSYNKQNITKLTCCTKEFVANTNVIMYYYLTWFILLVKWAADIPDWVSGERI